MPDSSSHCSDVGLYGEHDMRDCVSFAPQLILIINMMTIIDYKPPRLLRNFLLIIQRTIFVERVYGLNLERKYTIPRFRNTYTRDWKQRQISMGITYRSVGVLETRGAS